MDRVLEIPTFDVGVGADFGFTTAQVRDQWGELSAANIAASTFTVKIYNGEFPVGTLFTTLTGEIFPSSGKDFRALWKNTNGSQGTDQLTHGQALWAKYILNAGTDAEGVAFAKLRGVGA